MYCPRCGAHNEDADKMCNSCGQPIKKGRELAGFWRRYGASLLDMAILYILFILVLLIFVAIEIIGASATSSGNSGDTFGNAFGIVVMCFGYGICALIALLYFSWFESSRFQATPGKLAVGMIVIGLDGNRISFGKAIIRTLSKIISGLILYIGFFMIGFTEKRQGLHDMIAGTTVVMKNAVYLDLPEAPK
jgi:uncharacterized RDD family membrane protein YckC